MVDAARPQNPDIDDGDDENVPENPRNSPPVPGIQSFDFNIQETPGMQTLPGVPNSVSKTEKPRFLGVGPRAGAQDGLAIPLEHISQFLEDTAMSTFVDATHAYAASMDGNFIH
jgi:hypothetical protein